MPPLSNLATRDVETLVHPYVNLASFRESGPLVIERGQGVFVYDTDGKPYIEGMAGELFLEEESDVSRYKLVVEHLRAVADSPDASGSLIADLVAQM